MKGRKTISPSQLDAMGCRLAWDLGYAKGYRAKRSSNALELGTGIHAALENYYAKGTDPVGFFDDWAMARAREMDLQWDDDIAEMKKMQDLGHEMLKNYLIMYDGKDDFTVVATEATLKRPLPIPGTDSLSRCDVVVRLDGLVRDNASGKLFSLEHKTFSRFSLPQLEMNHQFMAQVWVGQALAASMDLDEPVVGVIYNGLRKQADGPKVKLSLFERHKLYYNQHQIDTFLYRAYCQYREMNRKDVAIYPQPSTMRCGQCDFREVCAEYQRGGDYQFILNESFTQRTQDTPKQNAIIAADDEE